ncbi:hypothetical protein Dimus_023419 [Dionaea muscipula]
MADRLWKMYAGNLEVLNQKSMLLRLQSLSRSVSADIIAKSYLRQVDGKFMGLGSDDDIRLAVAEVCPAGLYHRSRTRRVLPHRVGGRVDQFPSLHRSDSMIRLQNMSAAQPRRRQVWPRFSIGESKGSSNQSNPLYFVLQDHATSLGSFVRIQLQRLNLLERDSRTRENDKASTICILGHCFYSSCPDSSKANTEVMADSIWRATYRDGSRRVLGAFP